MNIAILETLDPAKLRRTRKRLRRLARRVPEQAADLAARAERQGRAVAEASTQRIRAHPLTAAALLFGAGLAAGALAAGVARR